VCLGFFLFVCVFFFRMVSVFCFLCGVGWGWVAVVLPLWFGWFVPQSGFPCCPVVFRSRPKIFSRRHSFIPPPCRLISHVCPQPQKTRLGSTICPIELSSRLPLSFRFFLDWVWPFSADSPPNCFFYPAFGVSDNRSPELRVDSFCPFASVPNPRLQTPR